MQNRINLWPGHKGQSSFNELSLWK